MIDDATWGRLVYEVGYWIAGLAVVVYCLAVALMTLTSTMTPMRADPPPVTAPATTVSAPLAEAAVIASPAPSPAAASPTAERDPAALIAAGSGTSFRDSLSDGAPCPACPELVVVPAGRFMMGSPAREGWRLDWQKERETPQIAITIARPLAVGRFAVTFDEWQACVDEHVCIADLADGGWGRARRPVMNITWDEASTYVAWLARKTGRPYRLLAEAEREYVTRAGTTTPFWFGSAPSTRSANYQVQSADPDAPPPPSNDRTMPVDSFLPNAWGLFNVHGNVYDWTADCWTETIAGHPSDGGPTTTGDCTQRAVKGGSWLHPAMLMRSAARTHVSAAFRSPAIGLRVARDIGVGG